MHGARGSREGQPCVDTRIPLSGLGNRSMVPRTVNGRGKKWSVKGKERSRKRVLGLIGPALAFIVLVGTVAESRGGPLTLVITAADSAQLIITGGPNGTLSNNNNTLTVTNIAAVNSFLS